ncbi:hypothetical protein [Streptomyces sp. NBC_00525]|uniref:hypothetical protein n=1 Tax=Streptomyces sp. NBC_00525 TaxID=2903660 RepID=UPI002E800FE6|nr:hypothetical protein [Streptomyces sp. NBC_00525]WUC95133.1 hypothetical protein OG710_16750 [Streptomyces sp. NBC_00525]
MAGGLYVEARIRAGLECVWERSQDPAQHQRWDLRFTRIAYLPVAEGEPQRFTYGVRVLPGLLVAGTGVSAGERHRPDGTRTSALRFACAHPLSFLTEGRGYWRYVPGPDGLRFLTGYDYEPRWGRPGRLADRVVFRPLMGWATAWSFDRLRLWCERGVTPERALLRGLAEAAARVAALAGAVWVAGASAAGARGGGLRGAGLWGAGSWGGGLGSVPALLGSVPALLVAVTVLLAALLLPPLPGTPSARRCLRRPPGRGTGTGADVGAPPALLDRLEQP